MKHNITDGMPRLQDALLAAGAAAYFTGFLVAVETALARLAY